MYVVQLARMTFSEVPALALPGCGGAPEPTSEEASEEAALLITSCDGDPYT